MRILFTLLMAALVAAGVAWLVAGDRFGSTRPAADAADPTIEPLSALRPEKVQKIDLTPPGQPTVSLTRNPDGSWSQPGNWPVRSAEATALLNALTGLRTRFHPVKLGSDADLSKYGLAADQKPAVAVVQLDGKTTTLRIGQPPAAGDESPFGRPCYVRVDDLMEVVRLGPDVWPVVTRPADEYRRRQLFPDAVRVKLTGGEPPSDPVAADAPAAGRVALLGDGYDSVRLERSAPTKESVTLKRTAPTPEVRRDPDRPTAEAGLTAARVAQAWEIDAEANDGKAKFRDRVDPAKLRAVLTTVPDLWVEKFVDKTPDEAGLSEAAKPDRAITVTRAGGRAVTVRLGKVSRTVNRVEEQQPPQPFAPPPPPPKVTTEEYRYAKLDNNPLVFEVRTDKLNDLFADADTFRDPQLARFEPSDATEVVVSRKGQPPIQLTKKKGNKDADRDEDKQDRWYVGNVLAEPGKVTDLLDQLSRLEAKGKDDRLDNPDEAKWKELALDAPDATKVTVIAQAKTVDGEPPAPPRSFTFVVGKDDAEKKKLAVQVTGWPRVNLVDDAVLKNIHRPALAYRGRRLFDTAEAKLTSLTVKRAGGEGFALTSEPNGSSARWLLTQPLKADADEAKASQLAGDLSRLEVAEYVDDAPKPDDIDKKYGLAAPRFTAALGFTGKDAKPRTLELGAPRDGKPEVYARLDGGGSVFAVPKATADELDAGALGLLPLQLWSVPSDKVAGVEIRRSEVNGNESYRVAKDGSAWKLSGPFDAAVSYPDVLPLLTAVAAVKAEKYEAISAPDPAKYGFDKPALRLTVNYTDGGDEPRRSLGNVSRTLVVGNPIADGATSRFARLDGGPTQAVFVLPDSLMKEADRPALGWLDKSILVIDPAKVSKVQLSGSTPEATVTLVRDPQAGWKAEGVSFAVDKPTVEAIVQTAARPPVARLAAYGSGVSWAAYGLDTPTATVTLTVDGAAGSPPTTHTLKLGKAEANGDRFVRADDGPAVGVLLPRAAETLSRGKLDFVDRTLLAFDPTALTAVVRKKGADELELTQAGAGWEITKPAKQKADAATLEDLADQLSKLRATKVAAFAPTADELAKFGLKEPTATLTLKISTDKPADKGLNIGGPVDAAKPDGDRYAATAPADPANGVTVGVLPATVADRLLADPLKFRDKALAKFVDADKVTLERGDRKVTFAKVDGTWKVTAPLTADAEQADLDEFVNAAANLRADELEADKPADLKPYGLDAPEAKWTFSAGDKKVLGLLVGAKSKDGSRAFAKTDKGEVVALLDPGLTAKALGEYRKRQVWPDVDASQAETLVLSAAGGSNTILRKNNGVWVDSQKPTEPIDQEKVTETLAALAGLKAERYVADKGAKVELYGLDKPARVIVVTMKGNKNKSLRMGGQVGGTDGKQVYAQAGESGRTEVFVLSEADTAKLTRDRTAFVGKK